MPRLGLIDETMVVVRWLKAEGDDMQEGEPVLQVETEKSNVDVEAPHTGTLVKIACEEGRTVDVGALLAQLGVDDGVLESPVANIDGPEPTPERNPDAATGAVLSELAINAAVDSRVVATPAARHRAKQAGLALTNVKGTGPGGRIQLRDVEELTGVFSETVALTGMRRAMARLMTLSAESIPQFALTRQICWRSVHEVRSEVTTRLQRLGLPVPSLNDFLLQAVARALMAHPDMNAIFMGTPKDSGARIVRLNGAHIGIAVALRDGVVVPVLHDVQTLSLCEIAHIRSDILNRANGGGLKAKDLHGAGLSISNLGANGPDRFTALVIPGQSAMLAVGRARDAPLVQAGSIAVASVSDVTLSVDHRLIDGTGAAKFLNHLTNLIESHDWQVGLER